ncbi:helix-turn-helix domain-containing protein [Corynebacterium striatum]|nr:helix-turn-helix domain-containing protein [Corynebacterium striatum]MDC7106899.1 helix-turn-helix domain-containing protein [Corynebacterium striatum]
MTDSIEPWVTMKDVQEHIGARRETITQWIGKQNMPAYKVGRQWKFKLSEIDEWVRSGGAADDEYPTGRAEEDTDA